MDEIFRWSHGGSCGFLFYFNEFKFLSLMNQTDIYSSLHNRETCTWSNEGEKVGILVATAKWSTRICRHCRCPLEQQRGGYGPVWYHFYSVSLFPFRKLVFLKRVFFLFFLNRNKRAAFGMHTQKLLFWDRNSFIFDSFVLQEIIIWNINSISCFQQHIKC